MAKQTKEERRKAKNESQNRIRAEARRKKEAQKEANRLRVQKHRAKKKLEKIIMNNNQGQFNNGGGQRGNNNIVPMFGNNRNNIFGPAQPGAAVVYGPNNVAVNSNAMAPCLAGANTTGASSNWSNAVDVQPLVSTNTIANMGRQERSQLDAVLREAHHELSQRTQQRIFAEQNRILAEQNIERDRLEFNQVLAARIASITTAVNAEATMAVGRHNATPGAQSPMATPQATMARHATPQAQATMTSSIRPPNGTPLRTTHHHNSMASNHPNHPVLPSSSRKRQRSGISFVINMG
mmetsp:Transcript_30796/g.51185  ORF Transcript_30796/g.51185 Transcript_30796/m.51185 type:complete len:294 (+) Transcript_30796:1353-2234(+)|eukprot:CAMPEP_0178742690 /NCGR_PEP_ID=MMETSP0744-20121128/5812_1 /TAXON_ID=913974 /ORGANISM="Nitzschia punctata, Strain CCMP561" /LENGTH=293 /DNA_ID=CAMNT_0020395655 /DNA_START=1779 /DNA_END=2660 /DNA_ORIENTATION=+